MLREDLTTRVSNAELASDACPRGIRSEMLRIANKIIKGENYKLF